LDFGALTEAIDTFDERDKFFKSTFPGIVQLADRLHQLAPLPEPLVAGKQGKIELTQEQCACILANSFFCRWSRDSDFGFGTNWCFVNYDQMFSAAPNKQAKIAKLQMLFNYFFRVTNEMPPGKITIERKVLNTFPDFSNIDLPLRNLIVAEKGGIGDVSLTLEVDFANKYIGGGSMSYGCVQEEIKFSICPELNVCQLFCEVMQDNEAIVITGGEQFSKHTGYGFNLAYAGNYVDTQKDYDGNITKKTVAIDALVISQFYSQFEKELIDRELNKAYVGFFEDTTADKTPLIPISSGNWGCGAFRGDKQLKSILQWIAASAANRDLIYYTFDNNTDFPRDLRNFFLELRKAKTTIGEIYKAIVAVGSDIALNYDEKANAFERVLDHLGLAKKK